jgi:conjugal transfer pilus assembly protein TraW
MKSSAFIILFVLIMLLINFMLVLKAKAVDLGTLGTSFEINEEDFEEHIVKQLKNLGEDKLKNHQELIKDKIVANIKRPKPVKGISKASEYKSRLYDPSFILQENIYDHKNQLLYPIGTIINPLEKRAFDEVWILIDGDDLAQVDFAKNYREIQIKDDIRSEQNEQNTQQTQQKENGEKIKKIILIKGRPGIQNDKSFFFFDQMGEISKKLSITKVPSIVRQAPDQPQILIEEIALDKQYDKSLVDYTTAPKRLDDKEK